MMSPNKGHHLFGVLFLTNNIWKYANKYLYLQ